MRGCSGVGHAWLLPGGACMVAPKWVCMVALGGGMHGCSEGHAWLLPGGHAWDTTRYGDTINEQVVCILLECILVTTFYYCPQMKFGGKVIFLHLFVILFTGGGVCSQGGSACSRRWDAWSGPWGVFSRGCLVLGVLRGVPGLVRGGSALGGVPGPGGSLVPGGACSQGRCLVETSPDGYCCGRHASYWDAWKRKDQKFSN